jgi:hypothetical protein
MGWSGYFYGVDGVFAGLFFLPLINNLTNQSAVDSFQPFFQALNETQGLTLSGAEVTQFSSAQFFLSGGPSQPGSTGNSVLLGSRLIPKALLQEPSSRTELANIIASIRNDSASRTIVGHLVAGGAPTKRPIAQSSLLGGKPSGIWFSLPYHQ